MQGRRQDLLSGCLYQYPSPFPPFLFHVDHSSPPQSGRVNATAGLGALQVIAPSVRLRSGAARAWAGNTFSVTKKPGNVPGGVIFCWRKCEFEVNVLDVVTWLLLE